MTEIIIMPKGTVMVEIKNEVKSQSYYNKWAREFVEKTWGKGLNIPIVLYNRKNSGRNGFFRYGYHMLGTVKDYYPIEIKLNTANLKKHDELLDTLKHELCHWYCCVSGLDFDDGDKDFEEQLKLVGARSTHTGDNKEQSLAIQEAVIRSTIKDTKFKIVRQDEIKNIIDMSLALKKWDWMKVLTVYNVYYKDMQVGLIAKCSGNNWIDLLNNDEAVWKPTRKALANELVGRAILYLEKNKEEN